MSLFLRKLLLVSLIYGFALSITAHEKREGDQIWEPQVVGTPPSDAYIGLSLLESGEIRHYNYGEQAEQGSFYLFSNDKGETWKKVNTPKEIPFADIQSPESGEYIRVIAAPGMGTYAIRTEGGLDGGRELIKVSDTMAIMVKPPIFINEGKRIIVPAHYGLQRGLPKSCFTLYSDDDGKTWKRSTLITTPDHEGGGFHDGKRWNHGAAEPTVIELNNGNLWMLIRTSQDHHYQSFSEDGGETWSEATPSPFYGTITMPTIGRLKDGRILFLWSNTTPLPEVNGVDGVWEDVFTNRNAIHAAVSSDDGKTWQGFRELYLDPRRDAFDFGTVPGIDKSVHQSQFVELDSGEVLVSLGQHPLHRVMLRFNVDWLYEKERKTDFSDGLEQWSTFNYYEGIVGHCAYNRTPGCSIEDGNLLIRYIENDSLLSSVRGAVWNFPAFHKGKISLSIRFNDLNTKGKLVLNDRWFNPTDTVATHFAPFSLALNPENLQIKDTEFHLLEIKWDLNTNNSGAEVYVDNQKVKTLPLKNESLHGLSYLHLLSDKVDGDKGYTIEWVKAKESKLHLLPKPQNISTNWSLRHQLKEGKIKDSVIFEKIVEEIQGADINQEEAYRLIVTVDSILIEATTNKGIYWARQTLKQLVMNAQDDDYTIPTLEITDWPAFRVRGFMHDVGRSFISVEELKKQIALLSHYKINVFHWHLTENQGWRLESKRFPELNEDSSFSRLHGKYYTIENALEIAEWCRKHNVQLIPEIDMPGHSAAFIRATGYDMQSEEGMRILKDLMEEVSTVVFPDVEYIHIGTDEVQFTNPAFVPEMVAHIRGFGKKVISWNPGWNYKPGEIDATQLWSYRGKAQPGIPAIDSRFHYINHFDAFGDIVALYNSRVYDHDQGSDDLAGSILAIWNDRMLPTEDDIMLQNYFYPNILAFAERTWIGGGSEYFDKDGVILPLDEDDDVLKGFISFEERMLWHKKQNFTDEPFPYMKQTDMVWRISDPFDNNGNLEMRFPPEDSLAYSYNYNDKIYKTELARGAGIYLRHVWGEIVPAFYDNPKENSTAYAFTWVWSPKDQEIGLWFTTQDYSRSEADLAPPQGEWDYRKSSIWINKQIIEPPLWENTHTEKTNEITLKNENFVAREPVLVNLNEGWNSILLKLPIAEFSLPEVRLQKWMFNFMFVTSDGSERIEGLIYDPEQND